MAIHANSYGSAAEVAALSQMWTASGVFSTTTRPTLAQVESFIDQISGIMNIALSKQGFSIPITQEDAVMAIKSITNQLVSDLVQAANSSGRFFTDRALAAGISPLMMIRREISDWVLDQATGLVNLGVPQVGSTSTDYIGFRDTDDGGDSIQPIFQRKGFGNVFQDFDN